MNNTKRSYLYKTGGLYLNTLLKDDILKLDKSAGSYQFLTDIPETSSFDFEISYSVVQRIKLPDGKAAFMGESFDANQIPYKWSVFEHNTYFTLIINIYDVSPIKMVKAEFRLQERSITVSLRLKNQNDKVMFEPFFQPFGALLLNYLSHFNNGILLHSSGVNDGQRGYVFSAISGTGKSTMAGLWQQKGAQIINDDRLIIIPDNDKIIMTNTPMPYYQDIYKESVVSAIFLLKQSTDNYIKPLPGAIGITGLMANCIQFLYNKEMVKKHLESITNITKRCKVYEVGFKPTTEIIDTIRREFGG